MRALLLVLLLIPSRLYTQTLTGQVGVQGVTPLGQLGSILTATLPNLSNQGLSPGSMDVSLKGTLAEVKAQTPVGLDPVKAAILVERAKEISAPQQPAVSEKKGVQEVLVAVNSVLKDIPADELKSMPAEKLHGLAGLIMDQMRPGAEDHAVEPVRQLSQANFARVRSLLGKPMKETWLNPGVSENHLQEWSVEGIPDGVKVVPAPENIVFRHYTTEEGQGRISKLKRLWNGFLSYVQLAPGLYRKYFKDLTGVFLTVPGVRGSEVGVPEGQFPAYVDLRIPAGFPLLEIEPGKIFLIPMPGRTRDWVRSYYMRWLNGEAVGSGYDTMVKKVDSEGGPGPALSVPIEIVGQGKARED
ncbi:MAG: hypothetical protein WC728_09405 [Elusimicrobiota bacterium]